MVGSGSKSEYIVLWSCAKSSAVKIVKSSFPRKRRALTSKKTTNQNRPCLNQQKYVLQYLLTPGRGFHHGDQLHSSKPWLRVVTRISFTWDSGVMFYNKIRRKRKNEALRTCLYLSRKNHEKGKVNAVDSYPKTGCLDFSTVKDVCSMIP